MKPGYSTQIDPSWRATRRPGPDEPTTGEVVHDRPQTRLLNEPVLPDNHPIYADYVYVADGVPVVSDWHDITVREFKMREGITELRRCDLSGRGLL